ncbi:hypothetical protein TASIC1_0015000200 [Trichoderma asperellum]|uniref:Uncharacterized protein n=1 Tax=Trichoderma asperellum TaxID=101201 RepID=A0A6V8RB50_TRIAP|nr:hypothetical protein TASIC1_0015000200 [Trichoderma asperellum]
MGTTQKKKKKPKKASVKRKEKRTTTTLSCRTMEMINNSSIGITSLLRPDLRKSDSKSPRSRSTSFKNNFTVYLVKEPLDRLAFAQSRPHMEFRKAQLDPHQWWEKTATDQRERRLQAPLEPLVVRQRGCGRDALTAFHSAPSGHELSQQTATRSGLQRIERLSDSLIPGQPRPRAYPRAVQNYLPTSGLLPTSSPLPETPADEFAVNELDFEDHFDLLYSKHCNKQAPRRKKENTKNFT